MKRKLLIGILIVGMFVFCGCMSGFMGVPKQQENKETFGITSLSLEEFEDREYGQVYCGEVKPVNKQETISYHHKETLEYEINGNLPKYVGTLESRNCATVAGCILIGYYDRFCENLMPNFKSYIQLGSIIRYKGMEEEVMAVLTQLVPLMGTNIGHEGTTFFGFQEGMKKYSEKCGYEYQSENLMSGNKINFEKCKVSIDGGTPIAIFLSTYAYLDEIQKKDNTDTVVSAYYDVSHVVVGCGYRQDIYYNASGQVIAMREYIKVASGQSDHGICYLNINSIGDIDRVIAAKIS